MQCARAGRLRNERGSTLALMAVMLFAMLALAAFAIDLASLRDAESRGSAHRGCGRARGRECVPGPSLDRSRRRSIEARNRALRDRTARTWCGPTRSMSDELDPEPTNTYGWGKVRRLARPLEGRRRSTSFPTARRSGPGSGMPGVSTFFGGLLGVPSGHVQAKSTAWATTQGPTVNCLKPFVMPDMWYESDKTTQDVNGNNYMDPITHGHGQGAGWRVVEVPAADHRREGLLRAVRSRQCAIPVTAADRLRQRLRADLPGVTRQTSAFRSYSSRRLATATPAGRERMGNAFWLLDLDTRLKTSSEEVERRLRQSRDR